MIEFLFEVIVGTLLLLWWLIAGWVHKSHVEEPFTFRLLTGRSKPVGSRWGPVLAFLWPLLLLSECFMLMLALVLWPFIKPENK